MIFVFINYFPTKTFTSLHQLINKSLHQLIVQDYCQLTYFISYFFRPNVHFCDTEHCISCDQCDIISPPSLPPTPSPPAAHGATRRPTQWSTRWATSPYDGPQYGARWSSWRTSRNDAKWHDELWSHGGTRAADATQHAPRYDGPQV